jgi:hypothetical protein
MKKDKDKPKDKTKDASQSEPPRPLQIHDLSERVPTMTDKELDTLLANGRRLLAGGNAIQKKQAEVLVPLIEGEQAKRAAVKEEAKKAAAAKRAKRGKAAPVEAEAEAAPDPSPAEVN